ncbi:MAG: protein kinase [Deltaproteobacteria bacterium]|nr:protein kinase [Deltaproteobacteria bacterium]
MRAFRGTERFRILRRLGAGGMGVVYVAEDRQTGATVALKTLDVSTPERLMRLKREFRVLSDLRHPNVVTMGELVEHQGRWFFTMELVAGVSLLDYVRPRESKHDGSGAQTLDAPRTLQEWPDSEEALPRGLSPGELQEGGELVARPPLASPEPMGPAEITSPEPIPVLFDEARLRDSFGQLAAALEALHEHGLVHRDIKPGNVLVEPSGRVVLLDFGLVTERDEDGSWTSRDMVGTAAYMAPEQASSVVVGPEADWYAFGAMLFQALTGQLPFAGGAMKMAYEKLTSAPPLPSDRVPDVPADLDALCAALLRVEPETRPKGRAVVAWLGGRTGHAGPVLAASTASLHPVFVGRERELDRLRAALRDLPTEGAAHLCVRGESGIGKSAIVRRFTHEAMSDGVVVLAGRCYEREEVPYKAVDGVVDALARFLQRAPRVEVASYVPARAGVLADVFPVLRAVPAISDAPRHDVADPIELRQRMFAAFRELLQRLGDDKTLVVAIDDLQWADGDSLALLGDVLRKPDAPRCLLISTWRPTATDTKRVEGLLPVPTRTLDVERLANDEAIQLVGQLLERTIPEHADHGRVAATIAREAAGHPLFIDELVRHTLVEPDAAVMAALASRPILRLEDALAARLARLDEPSRRLMELVVTAGSPADRTTLAAAAEMTAAELDRRVGVLRAGNLLQTMGTRATGRVAPYHDRVRAAVIEQLDAESTASRHRTWARAIESSGRADPEALAVHYRAAGEIDLAARYAMEAAALADKSLAFDRAANLYRLALELAGDAHPKARSLRTSLGHALANAGRGAEAAEEYLAATGGSTAAEGLDLRRRASQQLLVTGHIDAGLRVLADVLASEGLRYPRTPLWALVLVLWYRMLLVLKGLRFRERDASEVTPRDLARIDVCWNAGIALATVDNVRGNAFHTRSLLLALRAGEPVRLSNAFAVEGGFASMAGERGRARAEKLLDEADRLARKVGNRHAIAVADGARGQVAYLSGRFREAIARCEKTEADFREHCVGTTWEINTMRLWAARSMLQVGDLESLRRKAGRGIAEARDRGDRSASASLRLSVMAMVRLADDAPDEAAHEVEDALREWSVSGFHIQHYYGLFAGGSADVYAGRGERALERIVADWPRLRRAFLFRVQLIHLAMLDLRGRAALAAAWASPPGERARKIRSALDDAARIDAQDASWARPLATLLRACVAQSEGRLDDASSRYAEAAAAFDTHDLELHGAVARMREGHLRGGDEGRALVERATEWMRAQRVRAPDRMAALLAPVADDRPR